MLLLQVPGREQDVFYEHDLLEVSRRVIGTVAFSACGLKADGSGLSSHAYEVAGVDVADLPDVDGLLILWIKFNLRRLTALARRFQLVELPCLPAFRA